MITIFNMSITASWLILAVVLLRLVLRKAPRWIPVLLWGLVAFRLVCPFTIQSTISLIPNAEPIPVDVATQAEPTIDSGIGTMDDAINAALSESLTPNPGDSANPLQIWIPILTGVWVAGMVVLILYAFISYYRLHRQVATAVRYKDNIYQSENVTSPFVLGVLKPRIYLPFAVEVLDAVIAHEQAHIRRKDHWRKPLGYLILAIHWFNPLVWLAYVLLCRDIELACDEKVIKDLSAEQRADYLQSLVQCSIQSHRITACPLAYAEVGVKKRVKSVLHYKKPAFWVLLIAIISCAAVMVCFLTDPAEKEPDLSFLNYENAMSLVFDVDEVQVIYCPPDTTEIRIGAADGAELAKQLDRWEWKGCREPWNSLISPGSVEFVISEEHRITVHHRQKGSLWRYAVVKYGDEVRYYRTERNDYEEALALVHGPSAQPVAFEEKINEDVSIEAQDEAEYVPEQLHAKSIYAPTTVSQIEACYNNEDWVYIHLHYETEYGEWICNGYSYPYRLEITGEMPGTDKNMTFIVLSSTEDLTFTQTWQASGISSNMEDYFNAGEAVIVGSRVFE